MAKTIALATNKNQSRSFTLTPPISDGALAI
jgi:hypothetical protein